MEPFKALVLLTAAAIVSLVTAGAAGFYAGYSAGRGNLAEIKAYISNTQAVIPAGAGGAVSLKPVLDDLRALSSRVDALTAKTSGASESESDTKLVLDEIKGLSSQIDGLKQLPSLPVPGPAAAVPALPAAAQTISVSQDKMEPAAVVFYDNVLLKKDQDKQYDEIGVRLAVQAISAKQVRVAVNRQPFGLSFGERKVFRSQDVECEINLMETNLKEAQARLSISCKR